MKHSTGHIKLADHAYLAVSSARAIFRQPLPVMPAAKDHNNRQSRTYSFNQARSYLGSLHTKVTDNRGNIYTYARVVFLFEDDFIEEILLVVITVHATHAVFALYKSEEAAKHGHEPIYNTLFHNFEVREDGTLMIVAREQSPAPFAVWIREEPSRFPLEPSDA